MNFYTLFHEFLKLLKICEFIFTDFSTTGYRLSICGHVAHVLCINMHVPIHSPGSAACDAAIAKWLYSLVSVLLSVRTVNCELWTQTAQEPSYVRGLGLISVTRPNRSLSLSFLWGWWMRTTAASAGKGTDIARDALTPWPWSRNGSVWGLHGNGDQRRLLGPCGLT